MSDHMAWHNQDEFWLAFESMLFNEHRQANASVEFGQLAKLLNLETGNRILDLGCGTGRHSLEAARQAFQVVGVDRTARFIEQAQQLAAQEQLDVDFQVADMRAFCRPNSFDVIINLFGSFGYFEDPADDGQVAAHMYASLRPGGKVLIETLGKEIAARDFQEQAWFAHGDTIFLSERKPTHHWSRIQTKWTILRGNHRFEHVVSVRSYSAVELSSLLADRGFGTVQVYGNLEGRDYDHAAERLVVVGIKEMNSAPMNRIAGSQLAAADPVRGRG